MSGVRVAMWSGPRNISTAMMRAFSSRLDTAVIDEPFYAAYLHATGLVHPMRDAVLASQSVNWREVVGTLVGPIPNGKAVFYQKHMTHHMLPFIDQQWMSQCCNAFLIRSPVEVLASYVKKREEVDIADIGIVRQRELFQWEADRLGNAPPVIDAQSILRDPAASLSRLCAALGIDFQPAMLAWPAGRHPDDGVWAPAWYHAVELSTGFSPQRNEPAPRLPDHLMRIADEAMPHYEAMHRYCLRI